MQNESTSGLYRACRFDDLVPNKPLTVELDDRFVVIILLGETVYCIDDVCTHDGGPLGEGELEGSCLICPRHGAKFDVTNGAAVTMPATEATGSHKVHIRDNEVWIELADL